MKYELGQHVSILGTAVKVKTGVRGGFDITYREGPLPQRNHYDTPRVFTEGVIVGTRTVQEGRSDWDEGSIFNPRADTARRVWLVAFDLRMKPAMCFDDQIF